MQIEFSQSLDTGVLLIGHGTRDQAGLAEFAGTVRLVADQLQPVPVEPALLELATPTISAGFDRLVERGAQQIVAAPLLLFAAGHAKQDIPAALQAAASKHPTIVWRQAEHLGCHPQLLDLSTQRFREQLTVAASRRDAATTLRCRLIVVGRGSHDAEAIAETVHYAQLLGKRVAVDDVQTSFLAMAKPRLADVLAETAGGNCDVVIVQPHLLFHGELLEEVQQHVRDWIVRAPATQWLVTSHLGPAPQLVAAILERVHQCVLFCGQFRRAAGR